MWWKSLKWEGRNGERIGRIVIGGTERKERGVQEEERKTRQTEETVGRGLEKKPPSSCTKNERKGGRAGEGAGGRGIEGSYKK